MTFQEWGQSATFSTTVSASPTPTSTVFTVASVSTLRVSQAIWVTVSGTPQLTYITNISGNQLTVSPALSGAPDVPGAVTSYAEGVFNGKLNKGSVWKTTDQADLKASNTTGLTDGAIVYVPRQGAYRYNSTGSGADAAEYQVDPTTGPGLHELSLVHADAITEWVSETVSALRLELDKAKARIKALETINASGRAVHLFQKSIFSPGNGASVAANTEVETAISFPGILPTDLPLYNAPQDLEDQLVVAHVSIPVKDTFVVHIRNTKTGSVTVIPRPWYIGIIRNAN